METTQDIITAEHLTKSFGKLIAVDDLSLSVHKGEIFGFLGPNGAGKTTTVSLLTTMNLPDSGSIRIHGIDAIANRVEARRNIGIIQQQHSLEKEISVKENIIFHGLMQNMSRKEIYRSMDELVEIMELGDQMDKLIKDLSGGWKKRVAIVCSLIHNPDILFMDEPATGLDTRSRYLLHEMIRTISSKGTTIFLTTHYIYEAEELCDRVCIINKGKFVALGTPEELRAMVGAVALITTDEANHEHLKFFPTREAAADAAKTVEEKCDITIRESNLEDVFLELTGRKL